MHTKELELQQTPAGVEIEQYIAGNQKSTNLLSWDEVLDALANRQVTVRPGKDEIIIQDAKTLPVQVRLTMRYWKARHPEARQLVMNYVCAVATGEIKDLVDYPGPEYTAVIPERVGVDHEAIFA